MRWIKWLADSKNRLSVAAGLRRRRFALFRELIDALPRPVRVLDIGGTQMYWEQMGYTDEPDVHITIVNLKQNEPRHAMFSVVVGDGTDLSQYADGAFDVAFSNSVIEHVGGWAEQQRMAAEVRRVGRRYFVQTPNYWFTIEPHFLFPGFHWLPIAARVWLIRRFHLGWNTRFDQEAAARAKVAGIRLLRRKELRRLFPDAHLHAERVLGLVKSFVAYRGW